MKTSNQIIYTFFSILLFVAAVIAVNKTIGTEDILANAQNLEATSN